MSNEIPNWLKGCIKFHNTINGVFSPKLLKPRHEDLKNNKLKYFTKLAASICWKTAVCATGFIIAPTPTLVVIEASITSQAICEKAAEYYAAKASNAKVMPTTTLPKKILDEKTYNKLRGKEAPQRPIIKISYNPSMFSQNKKDL